MENRGTFRDFVDDELNYSIVEQKQDSELVDDKGRYAWAIPFVTGHRYRIHWEESLDFEEMNVHLRRSWEEEDEHIQISMNFTDIREKVEFNSMYSPWTYEYGYTSPNQSLTENIGVNRGLGDNIVYNETDFREMDFIVNLNKPERGHDL